MKRAIFISLFLLVIFTGCEEALLGPNPDNTPSNNFEILWKTMDENYPLFIQKGINWDSLHIVYGSKINANTNDSELWTIMTGLLSNLDEGHVMLFNKDQSKWFNASSTVNREYDFSLSLVNKNYLSSSTVTGAGYITFGKLKAGNIGYIYIASFAASNIGNGMDWAYDIDNVLQQLSSCDAIIVDVRNNGGGLRVTGDVINSAFIDHDFTYFYQRLKTGPRHDEFGSPRPISISMRPGIPIYNKKLVLLTNKFSASGAEYTAQVFKNLTYSTQIGDTTHGSFGEITCNAELPNGWIYWYPCSFTYTPDGMCPEGIGIIPDILVENTKSDIDAGRDKVLEYAAQFFAH